MISRADLKPGDAVECPRRHGAAGNHNAKVTNVDQTLSTVNTYVGLDCGHVIQMKAGHALFEAKEA